MAHSSSGRRTALVERSGPSVEVSRHAPLRHTQHALAANTEPAWAGSRRPAVRQPVAHLRCRRSAARRTGHERRHGQRGYAAGHRRPRGTGGRACRRCRMQQAHRPPRRVAGARRGARVRRQGAGRRAPRYELWLPRGAVRGGELRLLRIGTRDRHSRAGLGRRWPSRLARARARPSDRWSMVDARARRMAAVARVRGEGRPRGPRWARRSAERDGGLRARDAARPGGRRRTARARGRVPGGRRAPPRLGLHRDPAVRQHRAGTAR